VILAKRLHFDRLTFNEYTNTIIRNDGVSLSFDASASSDDLIFLVSSCEHGFTIRGIELTACADPKGAIFAFEVPLYVVVVITMSVATAANEWLIVYLIFVTIITVVLQSPKERCCFLGSQFFVYCKPSIIAFPNIA
jgi:hypothetical protein